MKEILFFNDTLKYGGTETLLVNALRYLSGKNCSITLLLPYPSDEYKLLEDIPSTIQITYLYPEKLTRGKKVIHENLVSFFPRLYPRLIKFDFNRFDLVVSFKDSMYSILLSRLNCRKILWIHNLPVKRKYEISSLKEFLPVKLLKIRNKRLIQSYRKFDKVIGVSKICIDRYIEIFNNGKIPHRQSIEVLYNAIDLNKIREMSLTRIPLQPTPPVFIMVTRLSHEKRIDRVIKAAAKLKTEGYGFNILIAGDGNNKNEIEQLIKSYGLEENIQLLGYLENPYPYIRASDWLICSSEKESFSLVILEAVFLGTSVITTDCGGPSEITANGKYGLLVENGSEGIYKGMKAILDKPEIAGKYKKHSSECLERFNYGKWLESVENIILYDQ